MHFQRSDSIFGSSPIKPFFIGKSRLETEFEELEVIGSGGFGEVIKVRNIMGGLGEGTTLEGCEEVKKMTGGLGLG